MEIKKVNLGELIRKKVEESGLTQAKFAELIGLQRQNVKKTVFDKHGLDTDLLCVISEVLNCNFFNYFMPCNISNYNPNKAKVKISIEMGTEKREKTIELSFGENKVKVE